MTPSAQPSNRARVFQARGIRIGPDESITPVTESVPVEIRMEVTKEGQVTFEWQDRISFPDFEGVVDGVGFYHEATGDLMAWQRVELRPGDTLDVGAL